MQGQQNAEAVAQGEQAGGQRAIPHGSLMSSSTMRLLHAAGADGTSLRIRAR